MSKKAEKNSRVRWTDDEKKLLLEAIKKQSEGKDVLKAEEWGLIIKDFNDKNRYIGDVEITDDKAGIYCQSKTSL